MKPPDLSPATTWSLSTRQLGRRLLVFQQLDSTNSLALSLGSDPANHGLVLLAHEQTAGRGQYGRTWQAPPGSSVLMSLVILPPPALRRPAVLTAWAAVGVSELIFEITGLQPKIKWPNDVYLNGKKVCGILIEQRSGHPTAPPLRERAQGGSPATAVGIGLNVSQPADFFELAGLTLGGSLLSVAGKNLDPQEVARRLILQLDDDYARLADGDYTMLEDRWKKRLGLLDKNVRVETLGGERRGRLLDVALEALVLDIGDEMPLRLAPEVVRHLELD